MRRKFKEENYDLIHCHWGYNTLFTYNKKIPIVTTYHGSDLQGEIDKFGSLSIKAYVMIFISRLSIYFSYVNIFVSERLARSVPRKTNNFKNHIIPMGFDEKKFIQSDKIKSKSKLGLSKSKKYVLFAGNYSQPVKGYLLAKKVMDFLDESYEMITLDYSPYDSMIDYMNSSDVLLMTSYQEGAPVIVKEAVACGLRVVSTDVGDVKKIIKDISNCFVVKNRNPEEIAAKIIESTSIVSSKIASRKIRSFSSEKMNSKVYELYLIIIRKRKFQ